MTRSAKPLPPRPPPSSPTWHKYGQTPHPSGQQAPPSPGSPPFPETTSGGGGKAVSNSHLKSLQDGFPRNLSQTQASQSGLFQPPAWREREGPGLKGSSDPSRAGWRGRFDGGVTCACARVSVCIAVVFVCLAVLVLLTTGVHPT